MAFPLSFKPKAAGDLIKSEEWNELMEEIDKRVKIAGDSMAGPLTINPPNALNFGGAVRQMINLWDTAYGIGVQGWTQYYRTAGNFAWFKGGAHADDPLNSGGGVQLMALNGNGDLLLTARTSPNGGDTAKCRALVDGGNLLILNYENDYFNGVQVGGTLPGTTTNKPSGLRVTGALSFGESGVDNHIGIARNGNDLRVTMRADGLSAGQTPYEFRIGHSYLWRVSGGVFGGIGAILSGFDSKFRASSTGNVYAETALHGTGADYAELFESETGKPIQAGVSVVLGKEGKVRAAKDGETPLGIISAHPGVIGNSPMNWPHRYVRNEFGEIVMENAEEEVMLPKKKRVETLDPATGQALQTEVDELDENGQVIWVPTGKKQKVNRPKMNPDYDPSKTYIPRNERPEWQKVGLIGQLRLRKGQPVAPNWVKIKDVSPEVELWLIK